MAAFLLGYDNYARDKKAKDHANPLNSKDQNRRVVSVVCRVRLWEVAMRRINTAGVSELVVERLVVSLEIVR